MSSDRIALRGRLVDQSTGLPLSGLLHVVTDGAPADGVPLAGDGTFALDLDRPADGLITLQDETGRQYGVDVSSLTPAVQATAGGGRLLLDYGGDPDMDGQTAESVAAQARADALAARTAASSVAAQAGALSSVLAIASATMQAALAAAAAAQARRIGLVVGRAAVPALAVNVDRPLPVTWAAPVAPASAVALLEPTGSLLGQVAATVRGDSLAPDGCTVLLRSSVLVAAGAGNVAAVGAYLI